MSEKKRVLQAIDLNGSPLDQFGGNEYEVWEDTDGKVHITLDKEFDLDGEKINALDKIIEGGGGGLPTGGENGSLLASLSKTITVKAPIEHEEDSLKPFSITFDTNKTIEEVVDIIENANLPWVDVETDEPFQIAFLFSDAYNSLWIEKYEEYYGIFIYEDYLLGQQVVFDTEEGWLLDDSTIWFNKDPYIQWSDLHYEKGTPVPTALNKFLYYKDESGNKLPVDFNYLDKVIYWDLQASKNSPKEVVDILDELIGENGFVTFFGAVEAGEEALSFVEASKEIEQDFILYNIIIGQNPIMEDTDYKVTFIHNLNSDTYEYDSCEYYIKNYSQDTEEINEIGLAILPWNMPETINGNLVFNEKVVEAEVETQWIKGLPLVKEKQKEIPLNDHIYKDIVYKVKRNDSLDWESMIGNLPQINCSTGQWYHPLLQVGLGFDTEARAQWTDEGMSYEYAYGVTGLMASSYTSGGTSYKDVAIGYSTYQFTRGNIWNNEHGWVLDKDRLVTLHFDFGAENDILINFMYQKDEEGNIHPINDASPVYFNAELTQEEIKNILGQVSFDDNHIYSIFKASFEGVPGANQPELVIRNYGEDYYSIEEVISLVDFYNLEWDNPWNEQYDFTKPLPIIYVSPYAEEMIEYVSQIITETESDIVPIDKALETNYDLVLGGSYGEVYAMEFSTISGDPIEIANKLKNNSPVDAVLLIPWKYYPQDPDFTGYDLWKLHDLRLESVSNGLWMTFAHSDYGVRGQYVNIEYISVHIDLENPETIEYLHRANIGAAILYS